MQAGSCYQQELNSAQSSRQRNSRLKAKDQMIFYHPLKMTLLKLATMQLKNWRFENIKIRPILQFVVKKSAKY